MPLSINITVNDSEAIFWPLLDFLKSQGYRSVPQQVIKDQSAQSKSQPQQIASDADVNVTHLLARIGEGSKTFLGGIVDYCRAQKTFTFTLADVANQVSGSHDNMKAHMRNVSKTLKALGMDSESMWERKWDYGHQRMVYTISVLYLEALESNLLR